MPIRPIDMQTAIPKLSEVSRMSHLEQQKAGLHQNQGAISNKKANNRENSAVMESHKDNKSGNDTDARKEGRNKYVNNRNKSGGSEDEDKKRPSGSINKIDIRI